MNLNLAKPTSTASPMSATRRWMIYFKERFPLPVYLLLSSGIVLSGRTLAGLGSPITLPWLPSLLALAALLLFFAELRLMDECKDYEKDLVAHPDRPLPRGLISVREVRSAIEILFCLMVIFAAVISYLTTPLAGAIDLALSGYLWLMYREFYLGEKLQSRPILYAITHQIILIPLCLFTVAILSPELVTSQEVVGYSIAVLGAFFGYEVCRKLDPSAHPVLKTYLNVYGAPRCAALVLALLALAAWGASQLGAGHLLWPAEAVLAIGLGILVIQPAKFKWVEGLATLSLLIHLWGATLWNFIERSL